MVLIYSFNYFTFSHVRPRSPFLARLLLLRVSSSRYFDFPSYSVGESVSSPAYVHILISFHDLLMRLMTSFSVISFKICSFTGCFPLRERPLYAISDGEVNPLDVGIPEFGTLSEYAEFRRMRHDKTFRR